jgi:hypothetical protein
LKIFEISGFFVDDNTEFEGYLAAEFNEVPEGWKDDDFFFFGLSESEIQESIESGQPIWNDFVITAYSVIQH